MHTILAIKPGRFVVCHLGSQSECDAEMRLLLAQGWAVKSFKSKSNIVANRKQRDHINDNLEYLKW